MRHLTSNTSGLRLLSVVTVAFTLFSFAPARAQENLPAPAGWTKSVAAGDVVFYQSTSDCRFVIKKLTPRGSDLRRWFDAQIERDGKTRGRIVSRGAVQAQQNSLTVTCSYRTADARQSVIYAGYPVAGQGRFLVFSGPTPTALARNVMSLNRLGEQLGALDAATTRRAANSPTKSGQTKGQQKPPVRVATAKLPPVAAKGTLKSAQILGVFLNESYSTGVGGGIIIQYDPVLLLRDGSARRDLEIPPLDIALDRDKASNRKDWGRWKKSGAKIVVRWGDGDSDEIKANFKTRPARPGETLSRGYSSLGGGGNTALGGDVMTFYSNSYQFARDGRFALKSSGGGVSSSVTALSSSKNGGRYRLDGYSLTLKFNDGRQVRRLFYFFPNDNKSDVIGIGDSSYIGDD